MKKTFFITICLIILGLQIAPLVFAADGIQLTVPIAGYNAKQEVPSAGNYIKSLYSWGVGVAALFAILFIVYGGFEYILSAGNIASQEHAKSRIQAAIYGLVLVIAAVLLINTINPAINNLNINKPIPITDPSGARLQPVGTDNLGNQINVKDPGAFGLNASERKTLSDIKNSFLYTDQVNTVVNQIVDSARNPSATEAERAAALNTWLNNALDHKAPFDQKKSDGTWAVDVTTTMDAALLIIKGNVTHQAFANLTKDFRDKNFAAFYNL